MVEHLVSRGVDAWHLSFIRSEEKLRAADAIQHLLGLLSTWLVYGTVRLWTGRS